MKKGQKVRIKSTGKVGVIADSEFFMWKGKKHVRYEVKFEDKPLTCWYPASDLASPKEVVKVTFEGEGGKLFVDMFIDWSKETSCHFDVTGLPENLQDHKGLHAVLAARFIETLSD